MLFDTITCSEAVFDNYYTETNKSLLYHHECALGSQELSIKEVRVNAKKAYKAMQLSITYQLHVCSRRMKA